MFDFLNCQVNNILYFYLPILGIIFHLKGEMMTRIYVYTPNTYIINMHITTLPGVGS